MDRKGSRSVRNHPERSKKRRFSGNQHTIEQETEYASTSASKLKEQEDNQVALTVGFFYCIFEFVSVFQKISSAVECKKCHQSVNFSMSSPRGLGFKINMQCQCEKSKKIPSCPYVNSAFEVNRRFIFVLRLLGIGLEGANLFCGLMDLGSGIAINTYYAAVENMHTAASAICEMSMSSAVGREKQALVKNGLPENKLTVSGDGSWKKRGFSSLIGVSSLIGKYSKQVLDVCVKSAFCGGCSAWKNKKNSDPVGYACWLDSHDNCTINHKGSSGKMEVDAIIEMFSRSQQKHNVKYLTYIGDGDSKTFKGILQSNPYPDEEVIKKECVGHVEKRMGTRLRNVKKNNKGIGGKGRGKLTDKVIGDLTRFYGLAIRRHPDSMKNMKEEIWATYYHCCSSDEVPQHQYCPAGENSWCKYRRAEALGLLENFKHDRIPLDPRVQEVIKPIFEDLSRDDLLKRCLGAETQNSNESFNSLVWTFAPKTLHSGFKINELASFLAVIIFNDGFTGIQKVMEVLGVKIGFHCDNYAKKRDNERMKRSELRCSNQYKQARIDNREKASTLHDFHENEEGVLYGPGIAD